MPDWISNIDLASVEAITTTVALTVAAIGAGIGKVRRAIAQIWHRARGRAGPLAAVVVLAVSLSGCAAVGIAGGIIATGAGAYCAGVSNAAKHAVRDTVTAGRQIIACEEEDGDE